MSRQVLLRHDIFGNWHNINPILALGEVGVDTSNNKIKIGDGRNRWDDVSYISYTVSEIDTKLASKADATHLHTGIYEPVITKATAFNVAFAGTGSASTVNHSDHTHTNDVGIGGPYYTQTVLKTSGSGAQVHYNNLIGVPLSFTPSSHTQTHDTISDWDTYVNSTSVFAAYGHTHNNTSTIGGPYEAQLSHPATTGYLLASDTVGTKSWVAPYVLLTSTTSRLGGVIVKDGLSVDGSGYISVSYAGSTGTYGSALTVARSDHGHNFAGSSSVAGPANSVATKLTFSTSGGVLPGSDYDGSFARTVDYNTVGAAASSHSHAASSLTGTSLASSVVSSSLTTVGTIGTGVWNATVIGSTYGGTGVNNGGRTLAISGYSTTLSIPTSSVTYTLPAGPATLVATTGTVATATNTTGGIVAGTNIRVPTTQPTSLSDGDIWIA